MKTNEENSLVSLKEAYKVLEKLDIWDEENIHNALFSLIEKMGIKNGQMLWPVRTAITGLMASPGGAFEIADVLGKDETLRRINIGIKKLGGLE